MPRIVCLLVLVSSAAELVYQVLWMRRFALIFGGTAPAAAITLSAIFLGMALGSAVLGRLARRWPRRLLVFALLQIGMAAGAAIFEPVLRLYDAFLPGIYAVLSGRPAAFLAADAALAVAAVSVPAFFMGGVLPLLSHVIAGSSARAGPTVGGLYAASLAGACGGTMMVPGVLLPLLGANGGYLAAIAANLAVAVAAVTMDSLRRREDETVPAPGSWTRRKSISG